MHTTTKIINNSNSYIAIRQLFDGWQSVMYTTKSGLISILVTFVIKNCEEKDQVQVQSQV